MKKIDSSKHIAISIARQFFEEFGLKTESRGPKFIYPKTLYEFVINHTRLQAYLNDLGKYEDYMVKEANKEIRRLVRKHK